MQWTGSIAQAKAGQEPVFFVFNARRGRAGRINL